MENEVCFDYSTARVLCNDFGLVYFQVLSLMVDIYYGINPAKWVNENIIKSTFLTATGYVGSPTGRLYTFPTGYSYKYWCIPDFSNDGNRVIERVTNGSTSTTLVYDPIDYKYYQTNPNPSQSIPYGKININGIPYRIYRTILKSSSNNEQYVYSF